MSGPSGSPAPIRPSMSQSTPYEVPDNPLTDKYISPSESSLQVILTVESVTIGEFSLLIVIVLLLVHKLSSVTVIW